MNLFFSNINQPQSRPIHTQPIHTQPIRTQPRKIPDKKINDKVFDSKDEMNNFLDDILKKNE